MIPNVIEREVVNLHQHFEDWFGGRCENSDAFFENNFLSRLAPSFRIVMPRGALLSGEALFADIRNAHGSNPQFRIQVRRIEVAVLDQQENLVLVTYEESQHDALISNPPNKRSHRQRYA